MTVNVYERYYSASGTFSGVERRAALVMLISDSCDGMIKYTAAVTFSRTSRRMISPCPTTLISSANCIPQREEDRKKEKLRFSKDFVRSSTRRRRNTK